MGRKPAFEREAAIQSALLVFWRLGYDMTSLDLLLNEMGIKLSSFYNSFKSKEALFMEVLLYYRQSMGRERLNILNSDEISGKEALVQFFDHLVYSSSKKGYPPGCFMMKTAVNLLRPDSTVGNEVANSIRNVERGFANALERGKKANQFIKSLDVEHASRILLTTSYGISVLSRTKKSKKELFDTAQALVGMFLR